VKSWVAFDAEGIPFGFTSAIHYTMAQAAKEFPDAVEIRLVEGEERSELLRRYAKW
jgi:hypothetical protein